MPTAAASSEGLTGAGGSAPRWLPHKVLAVPHHMGLSVGCLSVLTTWQPTPLRTSTQEIKHRGSDSTFYDLVSEIIHLISTLSYSLEASDHDQPTLRRRGWGISFHCSRSTKEFTGIF